MALSWCGGRAWLRLDSAAEADRATLIRRVTFALTGVEPQRVVHEILA